MYVSVGSLWKKINNGYVSVGGFWKKINTGYVAVGGLWKKFFTTEVLAPQYSVIISQATNGTTYLTTLTGTNYYWSPGPPSLTYRFQWWNGVSWSDISTASANNPAYGSSTSYTQLLQSTGPSVYVQPNQVNRFRFKVDATYGVESASSISSETTIQGPTSVTLTAGTAATTSVDLSWTASTGANRYMIYYSTNNSVFSLYGGTSLTSATVAGLTPATLYYFKVIPITGFTNDTGYYGSYSNTVSQSTLTPQYTVTWSVNLSGATVSPASNTVNSGTSVTAPTPTRSGYTFLYWRDSPSAFSYLYQINPGGSWTVTYNITFYAWWSLNPVIPSGGTVSISTNTGNYNVGSIITYSTTGWSDTPTSYSLRLYNGTNPVLTSDPLRASTSSTSGTYTIVAGDVPNYFKAFATASNSAGTSTEASSTQVGPAVAVFVTPTAGAPQVSNSQLGFIRSGTSVTWYSDYPSTSGDVSSIIGMEWQIRTTNSTTTTPLNTGTYAGGGSGDGLQGNTTKYMTYPISTPYPYSAAGTIWAFRIRSTENTAATASSRFARARVIMMGTDNNVYFGTWSTNI